MTGRRWQGSANKDGDCPSENDAWLCTLPAGHPPIDGPPVHEAWGIHGDCPIVVWAEGGRVVEVRHGALREAAQ